MMLPDVRTALGGLGAAACVLAAVALWTWILVVVADNAPRQKRRKPDA